VTRALPVAVALSLALGACGDGDEDDGRKLEIEPIERGIARGVERDRPGTKVVEVVCPDDVELRKGVTFTCRVMGSKRGQDAIASVTQVDDEGRVRYRIP
jgi:hypothetical protein